MKWLLLFLVSMSSHAGYVVKYYCVQVPVGSAIKIRHLNDYEVCCKDIKYYTDAHITLSHCGKGISEILNPNNVFVKEIYYENNGHEAILDMRRHERRITH